MPAVRNPPFRVMAQLDADALKVRPQGKAVRRLAPTFTLSFAPVVTKFIPVCCPEEVEYE